MTAQSIGAAKGGGYARYLESKTIAPEPGAYYLTPEGEPTQPRGRWHGSPATLRRLGIDGPAVDGRQFAALMEGRDASGQDWLRKAGANGERGGGIDVTFSAPKSVSVAWALGDEKARKQIEAAHTDAVADALTHLRATVPLVRRRVEGAVVEEPAADLIAAEFRHTTARGVVPGDMPDPQLHSHIVITTAIRADGCCVAVASRPVFRAAREVGAYYRSALAHHLKDAGYEIDAGTGRGGRYFEVRGYSRDLLDAFSARSREVTAAAERFRAKFGRPPERGELRIVKQENRRRKALVNRGDLDRAWSDTARQIQTPSRHDAHERAGSAGDRIEATLTERAATFTASELRAVGLEQTVGELPPDRALKFAERLVSDGRVVSLGGAGMTTRTIRAREQHLERAFAALCASDRSAPLDRDRAAAVESVAQRIGAMPDQEQLEALRVVSGPRRAAVLIGPAGTGKGIVIDAAAYAEQAAGNRTYGIAIAGSTAQRLGHDSPSLAGQTLTVDAFIERVRRDKLAVDGKAVVYFDESGMADTERLGSVTQLVRDGGGKLVLVGDAAQLPSIGAGGMLARLAERAPLAELRAVWRTSDPAERRAWADLRAGRTDRAMAHYRSRGRLHLAPTRDGAVERAVLTWARLTRDRPVEEIALLSDASNVEIDRLNARAQSLRVGRGDLGHEEIPIPGTHYGVRVADRVATIQQHHPSGTARIENGSRGIVVAADRVNRAVRVRFDATGREERFADADLGKLRLGYAQHIYRAQGATVDRALVLTGGWQTSREATYVEASRARHGTDWYVNREELGAEGHDSERIARLATKMRASRAQIPSLEWRESRPAHLDGRPALYGLLGRRRRRHTRDRPVDRGR